MAKLSSPSLFTRLYLIIAIAMIVSGTVSVYFISHIHTQGAVDGYVSFTDEIYAKLLEEKKIGHNTALENLNEEVNKVDGFLINWQIRFKNDSPCEDCELFGQSNKIKVYSNTLEQFHAVYKLPNVEAWLVISESNFFSFDNEDEVVETSIFSQYSFHDFEEVVTLMAVFLTIAGAIYWPVRVIRRQIEDLIQIQHNFGAGDMQARAGDQFTKPLDELALSFNSMASSISDTVNENQVFAQAVPHEVRTPLSRIQLAVGLLGQNNVNQEQIDLLDNIDTYIDDISVLINQVVSFSKLNAAKGHKEISLYRQIDLSEFIKSRITATKCNEKIEIICHLDDSLKMSTNPAYLRLLLDNLLNNACIHANSQLVVTLNLVDGQTVLSVEDDGNGVPKEYLETIFVPFARVDVSRSRKTGGLGLGLAIAKAACKRMSCHLTVENSPAAGAKFICRFS